MRVLLVDDDPHIRELIPLLLRGSEVVTAFDAATAIDELHKGEFDVAILDYSIPAVRGDDLSRLIRRGFPGLPIVGFSAMPASFADGEEKWADAYLDKRNLTDLAETISNVVGAKAEH